jgi:rare lipoprotein A (peptidoglycan hydrolase)
MVLKPGCRVQFNLMQFNKTFSLLFASALLFTPVKASAVSSPNYEIFEETNSQMNTTKWGLENYHKQQKVANVYTGTASWYGPGFYGNRTANGEVYRPGTYTIAHRYLRFGTRVRVTNLNNGRSAIARVNDRGPYVGGRIVDLGHGIARDLGVISSGLAHVRLEVLD